MPIIKCLSIIKGTKLESSFAGITDKMTVSQQREMALKSALDYHKGLHDELEGLKKSINKKHVKAKYTAPDYTEQVQRIKDREATAATPKVEPVVEKTKPTAKVEDKPTTKTQADQPSTFTKKVSELTVEERDAEIKALEKMLNDNVLKSKAVASFDEASTVGEVKSLFTTIPETIKALREYYSGDDSMLRTLDMIEPVLEGTNVYFDNNVDFEGGDVGQYDPKTGKVSININGNYSKTQILKTTVHELVHAATIHGIENNKAFARELTRVLDAFKSQKGLPESGGALLRMLEQARFEKDGKIMSFEDFYGATNIYELTAEIFTNKSFFDMLQKVEYKDYNLLRKIFETIISFFDASSKRVLDAKKSIGNVTNLADYVISLSEKVIEGTKTTPVEKLKYFSSKSDGQFSKSDAEARLAELKASIQPKAEQGTNSKEFDDLARQDLPRKGVTETKSNVETETGHVLPKELKEFDGVDFIQSLVYGDNVVEAAKTEFGSSYVTDLVNYINGAKMSFSKQAIMLVSLENSLNRDLLADPTNNRLQKQINLVTKLSIEHLRQGATAAAAGQFRWAARVNYNTELAAQSIFSPQEREHHQAVGGAIVSTPEDVQKQTELNEQKKADQEGEGVNEDLLDIINGLNKPKIAKEAAIKDFNDAFNRAVKAIQARSVQSTILPYAKQLADATPHIIAMAKALAKIGGITAKQIIDQIHNKLSPHIKGLKQTDITDAIRGANVSQALESKDLLDQAKSRIRERIDAKKANIDEKRAELTDTKKRFVEDAEYKGMQRELRELEKAEKEFLSEADKGILDDRKKATIVTKLEGEIAKLDEQIAKGERDAKEASKDPLQNEAINNLKDIKKAKIEVLLGLDPDMPALRKELADAGFGKEITVTVNSTDADGNPIKVKEKRNILDWTKLLGEEGSFENMRDALNKSIEGKGYSQAMIDALQTKLENEYNDMHADIIENKATAELNRRNSPNKSKAKLLSRRLAEAYNLGLYNSNPDAYANVMNNLLGINQLSQDAFTAIKEFNKSLAQLLESKDGDGNLYSDFELNTASTAIAAKIKKVVDTLHFAEGSMYYKTAVVINNIYSSMTTMLLATVNQFVLNPISSVANAIHTKLQDAFKREKSDTKALKKQRSIVANAVFNDIVAGGGAEYGAVGNPFTTKNSINDFINSIPDKIFKNEFLRKSGHILTAVADARFYLNAADSYFKVRMVELEFTHNLLRVLTDKTNPKAMSHQDALDYVSDALTGQSFEQAKVEARKIILKINTDAGKDVLKNTEMNVVRMANDLVKANLVRGGAINADEVLASLNAGDKTAGKSMGHEANNLASTRINLINANLQQKLDEARKNKEWSKAANNLFTLTISKNVLGLFVGGGSNWTTLGLQMSGLPTELWRDDVGFGVKPIDLVSDQGKRDLQKSLSAIATKQRMYGRMTVGLSFATSVILAIRYGVSEDEYKKWLKKHPKFKALTIKLQPLLVTIYMSIGEGYGDMAENILNAFGARADFDASKVKTILTNTGKTIFSDNPNAGREAKGAFGELVGSRFKIPYLASVSNFGTVFDDFKREFTTGKKKPKSKPSKSLRAGFLKGGFMEYLGYEPFKDKILTEAEKQAARAQRDIDRKNREEEKKANK